MAWASRGALGGVQGCGGRSMTKQDKFIAVFLIFQGLAGIATTLWLAALGGLSTGVLLVLAPAIVAALIAGVGSFRNLSWARALGIAVFAAQVPSFQTPWFFYSVWLGVHLNITLGWIDAGKVGVNLLALAMLIWALLRWRALAKPAASDPVRGPALGAWQPITVAELELLVVEQLEACSPSEREAFATRRVPFYAVPIRRYGAMGSVLVVAELPEGLLYYEDVEGGFEMGILEDGALLEAPCQQFELTHLLHRLGF